MNTSPDAKLPRWWIAVAVVSAAATGALLMSGYVVAVPPWSLGLLLFLVSAAAAAREWQIGKRHIAVCRRLRADDERARGQLQSLASDRLDNFAMDGMTQLARIGELGEQIVTLKEKIRSLEQRSTLEHQILSLAAREPPIDDAILMREFKMHEVVARQCVTDLVRALLLQPYPQPRGGFQLSPKGRNYLRDRGLLVKGA